MLCRRGSLTPLVAAPNTMPVGSFGPYHAAGEHHPARRGLLDQLRRGHPVGYRQDLIRVTPWASSGSFHLGSNDKGRRAPARVREDTPDRFDPYGACYDRGGLCGG